MSSCLKIDCRERGAEYIDFLRLTHTPEILFLEVGDIIVHDLAIERKTVGDFFATLQAGQLFPQLRRLKRAFRRQMLLIEGTGLRYHLDNEQFMGLYTRICAGWQIPILHTLNGEDTARVIRQILTHEVREPSGIPRFRPRNPAFEIREPSLRMLTSIPGLGPKRALALLQSFRTVSAVLAATEAELCQVPGIGRARARAIIAANSPFEAVAPGTVTHPRRKARHV